MPDTPAEPLLSWRPEFPVVDRFLYLNHAAISPPPRRATEAQCALARFLSETGDRYWEDREAHAEVVRARAAQLLGARFPHEVAFVANTAEGLSLVAMGLAWQAGDNIVGAGAEYPSNVYPWLMLGERGVEYRAVPERGGRIDPEELLAACDERTRLLVLSWVQYASGFRADLAAIGQECRRREILFVVDVIQGLGALPLDVEACAVDVAAGAGHKWLLGPEGMGLLYVSDRLRGRLRPTRAGWRSVAHRLDFGRIELLWESGARAFECGSLNHLGIRLLGESITLLGEIGIARIEPRVIALARRAAEGMAALGLEVVGGVEGVRSGIVCARHPSRPVAPWVAELERRDIVVAERLGRLRVSPNFYNTEDEVDCFLATLGELVP